MNARSLSRQLIYAACALTVLSLSQVAHAQTLGLDTGVGDNNTSIDEFSQGTVGWSFTVGAAPVTVTSLGFWDYQSETLMNDHAIGLWNASGTLLASTTVTNASTRVASNGAFGSWLFNSVSATTLAAGGTYTLGAFIPNSIGRSDASIYQDDTATTDSRITYSSALADSSIPLSGGSGATGLVRPTVAQPGLGPGIFGPNVEFAAAGSGAAPEPGSIALLASLALPLGGMVLRRRCRKS